MILKCKDSASEWNDKQNTQFLFFISERRLSYEKIKKVVRRQYMYHIILFD